MSKSRISISVDTALLKRFQADTREQAINRSALIESFIRLWVDTNDAGRAPIIEPQKSRQ